MNVLKSIRPSAPIATAILAAIALAGNAVSVAEERGNLPQAVVQFADLNVATHAGASALYRRIVAAAERVCDADAVDGRNLGATAQLGACVRTAIDGAVTEVGQPALSAIHAAKSQQPRSSMVATAGAR